MATGVDAKLLKSTKFPPEFNQKVDMQKVNLQVMKTWIAGKISDILGSEDDVVTELVYNLIEGSRYPDIKSLQIQLTGFLEKDTASFCKDLWNHCISAQASAQGIPRELLEAKKNELIKEKLDAEKAEEEARRRREEAERRRGGGRTDSYFGGSRRGDRGFDGRRGGFRGRDRSRSRSPPRGGRDFRDHDRAPFRGPRRDVYVPRERRGGTRNDFERRRGRSPTRSPSRDPSSSRSRSRSSSRVARRPGDRSVTPPRRRSSPGRRASPARSTGKRARSRSPRGGNFRRRSSKSPSRSPSPAPKRRRHYSSSRSRSRGRDARPHRSPKPSRFSRSASRSPPRGGARGRGTRDSSPDDDRLHRNDGKRRRSSTRSRSPPSPDRRQRQRRDRSRSAEGRGSGRGRRGDSDGKRRQNTSSVSSYSKSRGSTADVSGDEDRPGSSRRKEASRSPSQAKAAQRLANEQREKELREQLKKMRSSKSGPTNP